MKFYIEIIIYNDLANFIAVYNLSKTDIVVNANSTELYSKSITVNASYTLIGFCPYCTDHFTICSVRYWDNILSEDGTTRTITFHFTLYNRYNNDREISDSGVTLIFSL